MTSGDGAVEFRPLAAELGPLVLEARDLHKNFRLSHGPRGARLQAVRGVSLSLHRGAIVALVGESGSGKSTVARLLAGQQRRSGGQILLDGAEIDPASRRAFRAYKRSVQLIFQDPFASLNPVHTVRYHLQRPLLLHGAGRDTTITAQLDRLLEDVRLTPPEHYLAKYPHELSGGQRQRVAFARALAVSPRVLLADEPVSMLDVSIRLGVLDLIDDLRTRLAIAVLYITHDIASARYFADETLVMYAGEIVERGPSEDVTQRPAHPYTQLLVSAAPDPDRLGRQLRTAAPGAAPAAASLPAAAAAPRAGTPAGGGPGCRFSARCPFADQRCIEHSPPLQPISTRRAVACWHVDVAAPHLRAHPHAHIEEAITT